MGITNTSKKKINKLITNIVRKGMGTGEACVKAGYSHLATFRNAIQSKHAIGLMKDLNVNEAQVIGLAHQQTRANRNHTSIGSGYNNYRDPYINHLKDRILPYGQKTAFDQAVRDAALTYQANEIEAGYYTTLRESMHTISIIMLHKYEQKLWNIGSPIHEHLKLTFEMKRDINVTPKED